MIRHWCEVMGDANPAYLDAAAAKRSVHGGLVAPPTMLQTWDMRGWPMHDPSLIKNAQRDLHAIFDEAGYTGVVATDTESKITSTATPASFARSFIGTPSFSKVRSSSGSTSSMLFSFFGFGAE